MPVGIMLRSVTSYELTEWIAYFKIQKRITLGDEEINTGKVLKEMFSGRVKRGGKKK